MKKFILIFLSIFLSLLFVVNADALSLVAASISKDVTKNMVAQGISDTFSTDIPAIHAVVVFSGATAGDKVKGVWVAVDAIETPNYEIASTTLDLKEGEARAHFKLTRPNNGWPVGNYKLYIYVNDVFVTSVPFKVVKVVRPVPKQPQSRQYQTPSKNMVQHAGSGGVVGRWQCRVSFNGMTGAPEQVIFDQSGNATVGNQQFSYTIEGNILRLMDSNGASDYNYQLSGNNLTMRYADGSVFNCNRSNNTTAGLRQQRSPRIQANQGNTTLASGNEWQLQGTFCHWGGSSSYYSGSDYSGYSHTERITFDGRGNWAFGSEAAFNSDAGLAYGGQSNQDRGRYKIQGNQILYQTATGEQGVVRVNMRQNDGRITEIYVDHELYAPQLCQ